MEIERQAGVQKRGNETRTGDKARKNERRRRKIERKAGVQKRGKETGAGDKAGETERRRRR